MDKVTFAKNQPRVESWTQVINQSQQSGKTVVRWCEENDINIKNCYYWFCKLRKTELVQTSLLVRDEPVQPLAVVKHLDVAAPMSDTKSSVIFRLPNATLEITDGASQ